jgi:cytochrome c oxidase assembly factor CtaG
MEALGWTWRPEVVVPLAALALLYGAGWIRLAHRAPGPDVALVGRLLLAYGALAAIAAALLSPLHDLAHARFSAHMLQHMLLVAVAAPALLLADPFPMLLWALPEAARGAAGRRLAPGTPLRALWRALTWMPVAWLAHALVLWLWHLPAAYDAALERPLLHDLQHLTLFLSAVLFWWPVVDPAPRVAGPAHPGWRIAYLVLGAFQGAALGLLLALAPAVLYAPYAAGPAALDDQAWGGVVMWALGGTVDMAAVLALVFRFLAVEERAAGPAVSLTARRR